MASGLQIYGATPAALAAEVAARLAGDADDLNTGVLDTDATLAANSDAKIPSQKAAKGYVDTASGLLIPKSLVDAKGDLLVGTADNTVARKAVGANGKYLRANSGDASGVDWQAPFLTGTHAARLAASHVAGTLWKETDTGLIYLDDGSSWTVWKSDGFVRKTATGSAINNSTTLANDPELFFPIEANEIWFVEAFLQANGASVNADFKYGWTGPSGCTAQWGPLATLANLGSGWVGAGAAGGVSGGFSAINNNTNLAGMSGTLPHQLAGWFTNGSTAGTVTLQWAQNTQTVEDNKILVNSYLRLRRLA